MPATIYTDDREMGGYFNWDWGGGLPTVVSRALSHLFLILYMAISSTEIYAKRVILLKFAF